MVCKGWTGPVAVLMGVAVLSLSVHSAAQNNDHSLLSFIKRLFGGKKDETVPMTPAQIIQGEGYPSEVHHVTTADGYILQVDRIPRPGRPVVYLANQIFSSAAAYLILGKGKSIGFLLYEAGFDVWLSNFRGTNFSLTHVSLSSSDDNFWKFGFHEHGTLDNPAIIDYVLATTKQKDLVFLGHSMGGTTFFVTASERPDTLSKIRAAFLFAPAVFMSNTKDEVMRAGVRFANATMRIADLLHKHRQPVELLRQLLTGLCQKGLSKALNLCAKAGLGGVNRFLPDFAIFFPAGGSVGQLVHFLQVINPKWPGFRKYNYGSAQANRAKYGSDTPPDYKLRNINTPVYLYNGFGDKTCSVQDQTLLKNTLPNVKQFFYSANKNLNHRDFTLSDNAVNDVYNTVLADLKQFLKR